MGSYFDKLNGPRVTAALNVLAEAPFFYREDDPELFSFLRRNKAEFARFYDELYGWELLVDGRTARLYKERWHNRALRPSQHDVFDLTRRDDCLAFLLLLEHHDRLLETHNLAAADAAGPRFLFGELFAFARGRLAEELGDAAGDGDHVLYEALPALHHYDLRRLGPAALTRVFGPETAEGKP